jgi:Cu+-exporting ATPase
MSVDRATAAHKTSHAGVDYFFCCAGCLNKFSLDPARYLGGVARPAPPADPAAIYTCPMHPEIEQVGPGTCPLCGMALEPKGVPLDFDVPDPELIDFSRRLKVALVFTLPLFLLAMASHFGNAHALAGAWRPWAELALATPAVLWCGWPFFVRAWQSLVNRALNMFTLIGLGTAVAYGYSVVAVLAPGLFPPAMRDAHGGVGLYFEAAAVIVALVLLGQVLELRARRKTSAALRSLVELAPQEAVRVEPSGEERSLPLAEVKVGDRLRVKPGGRVPVDGVVTDGESAVDESMMSGEPIPLTKRVGDPVTGGTLNGSGSFVMRAEKVGAETLLARIVALVAEAQRSRAPIQRLADKVSAIFVPAVALVAALSFALWLVFGPEPRLAHAVVNAIAVLIIACPCALGLATPMSIMVAIGRGAVAGVLIRNAEQLEAIERVDVLVFDKTGTLTEGKPRVAAIATADGIEETTLLSLAANLEQGSEHPLAAAIVAEAKTRGLALSAPSGFAAIAGGGVRGIAAGRRLMVGAADFLAARRVDPTPLAARAEAMRRDGVTVVFVAVDGMLAGLIGIADPVRAEAAETVLALKRAGLRLVMLTGDSRATAEAIARRVGIDEIEAEVKPDQKAAFVKALRERGQVVAMAGDGINDAPALALAHVGIAMGTGTDIAIQSAGVTLVRGDLRGVLRAWRLARATMTNIRQNLAWAFAFNLLGVPIAAGLLYPVAGILLSPMLAAAAMSLSSVSVVANALRLRRIRL